jgi:hypothetical protein
MSPLLGITPPTDIVAKQRPDGEFPISKGYNLLSVSRNGKGNATPWGVTQRSGEGRGGSENIKKMLFDLRSKNKRDREKCEFIYPKIFWVGLPFWLVSTHQISAAGGWNMIWASDYPILNIYCNLDSTRDIDTGNIPLNKLKSPLSELPSSDIL